MSKISNGEGFIYVYPCIMGGTKNLCKIGVTDNFKERMSQHVRTPYHGFNCMLNYPSYKPIATALRIKNMDIADELVKDCFHDYQLAGIEVYNINYNVSIQELYNLLYEHKQYVELIEDGVTDYGFLVLKEEVKVDTTKPVFEALRDKILSKYNDELPEELLLLLRDVEEFKTHCSSHYETGNFVEFFDGLVLDIGVCKASRALLLNKLQELLKG